MDGQLDEAFNAISSLQEMQICHQSVGYYLGLLRCTRFIYVKFLLLITCLLLVKESLLALTIDPLIFIYFIDLFEKYDFHHF